MALFHGPALAHTSHDNPGDENRGKDGPSLPRPRRPAEFRQTSAQTIFLDYSFLHHMATAQQRQATG